MGGQRGNQAEQQQTELDKDDDELASAGKQDMRMSANT